MVTRFVTYLGRPRIDDKLDVTRQYPSYLPRRVPFLKRHRYFTRGNSSAEEVQARVGDYLAKNGFEVRLSEDPPEASRHHPEFSAPPPPSTETPVNLIARARNRRPSGPTLFAHVDIVTSDIRNLDDVIGCGGDWDNFISWLKRSAAIDARSSQRATVLRERPVRRAVAEMLTPSTRRPATWSNSLRVQRSV